MAIGRVQCENGMWRPDVSWLSLRVGGWVFRTAWRLIPGCALADACHAYYSGRPTWVQRVILYVHSNWAYWDCWDELSETDKSRLTQPKCLW